MTSGPPAPAPGETCPHCGRQVPPALTATGCIAVVDGDHFVFDPDRCRWVEEGDAA